MTLTIQLTDEQLEQLTEALVAKIGPAVGKRDGYSAAEAAQRLGVSKATVTRRIAAGLIPTIPNVSPARVPADYVARMMTQPHA